MPARPKVISGAVFSSFRPEARKPLCSRRACLQGLLKWHSLSASTRRLVVGWWLARHHNYILDVVSVELLILAGLHDCSLLDSFASDLSVRRLYTRGWSHKRSWRLELEVSWVIIWGVAVCNMPIPQISCWPSNLLVLRGRHNVGSMVGVFGTCCVQKGAAKITHAHTLSSNSRSLPEPEPWNKVFQELSAHFCSWAIDSASATMPQCPDATKHTCLLHALCAPTVSSPTVKSPWQVSLICSIIQSKTSTYLRHWSHSTWTQLKHDVTIPHQLLLFLLGILKIILASLEHIAYVHVSRAGTVMKAGCLN